MTKDHEDRIFSVVQQAHDEPKRTGRKTRDDLQRERAAICEREGHKRSEFRSGSKVLIYCRRCMVKL